MLLFALTVSRRAIDFRHDAVKGFVECGKELKMFAAIPARLVDQSFHISDTSALFPPAGRLQPYLQLSAVQAADCWRIDGG